MKKIFLEKSRIVYANDSFLNFFEIELKEVVLKSLETLDFKVFDKIGNKVLLFDKGKLIG